MISPLTVDRDGLDEKFLSPGTVHRDGKNSKSRNCPQGWEDLLSAGTVLRDENVF